MFNVRTTPSEYHSKNSFLFFRLTEHIAQIVNQQTSTSTNTQTPNNNNNTNTPDSILNSSFVVQSDSTSGTRNNEALRSRSADSRPSNTNTPASNLDDDDADWIDLPNMDMPVPPPPQPAVQHPIPPILPIPRLRGPAIIRMLSKKRKDSLLNFVFQNQSIEVYRVHHPISHKHFVHHLMIPIMLPI